MLSNWVGIFIGFVFVSIGYFMSLFYIPKKSENPQVTLTHLRYFYLESIALVVGGLILIITSLFLTVI